MLTPQITTLAFWTPGPLELVIILVIAVLLFGRRLPDIARSVGQSVTEFKRGLNTAKADIESAGDLPADQQNPYRDVSAKTNAAEGSSSSADTADQNAETAAHKS